MTTPLPASLDVLIVGAGLSGISAAWHLQDRCPGRSFAIVEAREAMGGTWDLFRYPGVRSDSDMFTLGYRFRPWTGGKVLADGPSIKAYIEETARDAGIDRVIHYGHRVLSASWSSADARWTVEIGVGDTVRRVVCRFLYAATGYYAYERGYAPEFTGIADYRGRVVHPQHWPDGLDVAGKRIVVIGSGATAVTLVPALAERGAQVVMLQRTPSYVVSQPATDALADRLRAALPASVAHPVLRWRNILRQQFYYQLARRWPKGVRRVILRRAQDALDGSAPVRPHFAPPYAPWDQRLCIVPDDDLFRAIRAGRAEVVTDRIEAFTEGGLRLVSGRELSADVVVTATGLQLRLLGGMRLSVDGEAVDTTKLLLYKGAMYAGVPNLVAAFGYTNASWTLKCDLIAGWFCRLIRHVERQGKQSAVPTPPPGLRTQPAVGLMAGYIERAKAAMPRQGTTGPWRVHQNYLSDLVELRYKPMGPDLTLR